MGKRTRCKARIYQARHTAQNAYIERFNRTYRNEVLDWYLFNSLRKVRDITDDWMIDYNYERTHESLNDLPPKIYEQQLT